MPQEELQDDSVTEAPEQSDSAEVSAPSEEQNQVHEPEQTLSEISDSSEQAEPVETQQPEQWTPPSREEYEQLQQRLSSLPQLEQRVRDNQAAFHQAQQRLKTYDGVDPEQVRAWRQAQEEARRKELPRWSRQHPENAHFQKLRDKASLVTQQVTQLRQTGVDDEKINSFINQNLTQEELNELQEYNNQKQSFQTQFFEDPQSAIAPFVEQMVEQRIEQVNRQYQQKTQVDQIMSSPDGQLLQKYSQEVSHLLTATGEEKVRLAVAMARLAEENQALKAQLNPAIRQQQAAQEQQRLLQADARIAPQGSQTKLSFKDFLKSRGKTVPDVSDYSEYELL